MGIFGWYVMVSVVCLLLRGGVGCVIIGVLVVGCLGLDDFGGVGWFGWLGGVVFEVGLFLGCLVFCLGVWVGLLGWVLGLVGVYMG
uniref:NADH dehydrogenase subunit 6 n=1 Tax=Knipowitschia caucasica TaxID=637954 RepID=A0AAV2IT08_KNICA